MTIAADLELIANSTNRELDAGYDFVEHSKAVWRSFGESVVGGQAVTVTTTGTGTTIDQTGLLARRSMYAEEFLATLTFRQFISTFEAFFFDFLHRVLRHNPWQFAKSQLDLETVLRSRDCGEVVGLVLLKQMNELRYGKPADWFEALNKSVKLDCPAPAEIEALAEAKATRDILEHNAGVVNEVYLRKAGKLARFAVGELVEIDDTYHLATWRLIKKIVADLTTAATAKLA
jgi:hypothetical protein